MKTSQKLVKKLKNKRKELWEQREAVMNNEPYLHDSRDMDSYDEYLDKRLTRIEALIKIDADLDKVSSKIERLTK